MGHSSIRMTFDLYGHLFEDIEADKADMAKIEAAINVAWGARDKTATCGRKTKNNQCAIVVL
jgi:hypothetical protein